MERDVSEFDAVTPPITEAKRRMIEATQSSSDQLVAAVLDDPPGELATKDMMVDFLRAAGRDRFVELR